MINLQKIFLISLMLSCSQVSANSFKGIKEVGILIENLDEDATKCNMTEDFLDAAVRLPISNSKIRVVDMNKFPSAYIYVKLIIIREQEMCTAYIRVALNKYIPGENTGEFWNKDGLLIYRKVNFQQKIGEQLESFTKQLISAWLKANQN